MTGVLGDTARVPRASENYATHETVGKRLLECERNRQPRLLGMIAYYWWLDISCIDQVLTLWASHAEREPLCFGPSQSWTGGARPSLCPSSYRLCGTVPCGVISSKGKIVGLSQEEVCWTDSRKVLVAGPAARRRASLGSEGLRRACPSFRSPREAHGSPPPLWLTFTVQARLCVLHSYVVDGQEQDMYSCSSRCCSCLNERISETCILDL